MIDSTVEVLFEAVTVVVVVVVAVVIVVVLMEAAGTFKFIDANYLCSTMYAVTRDAYT